MKINALRRELNRLTAPENGGRKAALRRSLREEWLYATDLPGIISGDELEAVRGRLRGAGWESLEEEGWMQLRKEISEPPEDWFDGPYGPEAGCCLSLAGRHPDMQKEPDRRIEYALIRAGEEGTEAYEAVCRRLHREWAARLRKKQKLPDVSLLFFGGGNKDADQAYRARGILDGNGERRPDRDGSV